MVDIAPRVTLELHGVARRFVAGAGSCNASVEALRSATVQIRAGEVVIVAGPRGSGKTTLLLCAAGLLHHDRGVIEGTPRVVVYRDLREPARPVEPPVLGAVYFLDHCDETGALARARAVRLIEQAVTARSAVVLAARDAGDAIGLVASSATISVVHLRLGETVGSPELIVPRHRVAEGVATRW